MRLVEVSLFHGSCGMHLQYGLSCEDAEALRADHRDACRLCGKADRYMGVDHDHAVAPWAVRGWLCRRCNATHMGRVDHGEYPIDPNTREYLLTPWYLARRGQRLHYEPMVDVRLSDLADADRDELRRLRSVVRTAYSLGRAQPSFAHAGVAECLAHGDLRPMLRLLWMQDRSWESVSITEHPYDNRRAGPHLAAQPFALRFTAV